MRTLASWFIAVAAGLCSTPAAADVYVVVNAANPAKSFQTKDVVDLFMGRNRSFAEGGYALLFDLPRDSLVRAEFYQQLTGMTAAQINSYWARLMFTGQTLPPQPLPNEAAVIDMVRRNPSAMGYLSSEPADRGLRVVLTLHSAER